MKFPWTEAGTNRLTFRKSDIKYLLVFVIFVAVVLFLLNGHNATLSRFTEVVLILELGFLVTATWVWAAYAVVKALFAVSAELTFIIFLAQAYCAPAVTHTANDALRTLVAVGLAYIVIEFVWTLYKEAITKARRLKEANDHKWPLLVVIPFALFTALFVWQAAQIVLPIVKDLCVYK